MRNFVVSALLIIFLSWWFPVTYWPEMLNYPFFMKNGWFLYRDFSSVYTPIFLYLLKFSYDIFGYTINTYRLFATTLFLITGLIVQSKSKNWFVTMFFVIAYLAFGGNAVWFDMFLTPIILILFTSKSPTLKSLLFGLAVLSKQTAFYLTPVVLKDLYKKPLPFLILLTGFFAFLFETNLVSDFWKWGISFVFLLPRNGDLSLPTIKQILVVTAFILPLLFTKNIKTIAWGLFSLLFAFPRFEFFHLLPFLAIWSVGVAKKPWLIFIPLIPTILLFKNTLELGNRFLEPVVLKIADDLSRESKTVLSVNGPDQIYFLSKKMPAVRPWVDQLPWQLEFSKEEFYSNFVKEKPDIIITRSYLQKPVQGLGAYKPIKIWDYIENNYHLTKTYDDGTQILETN